MAQLEDIVRGSSIRGILPDAIVSVLDVKLWERGEAPA